MLDQLESLQLDVIRYRQAVDHIFSPSLTNSKKWQACFSEILICTTRLYLDYLLVTKSLPELESLASKGRDMGQPSTNNSREMTLRAELKKRLDSSTGWPGFVPQNPFSNLTGLRTLRNYVNSFSLHLPEIYEETFRVEACTKSFLADHNGVALAQLSIGLQHLGKHHASFVLQPLEWAADEGSWDESLAVVVN